MEMSEDNGFVGYREPAPILPGEERWKDVKTTAELEAERELERLKELDARIERVRSTMAKPEELNLPPLLEQKRQELLIPNGFFDEQCIYDRVLLYPVIEVLRDKKAGDTTIIMPDSAKRREEETAPMGVLVSAGLQALDHLRSYGIELGHTVRYAQFSIIWVPCDCIDGRYFYGVPLRSCDLFSSLDLMKEIRAGKKRVVYDEAGAQHRMKVGDKLVDQVNPNPNEF